MRYLVIKILSLLLVAAYFGTGSNADSRKGEAYKYVIYINAVQPGNAVTFEGAYLFYHDRSLGHVELVEKKTPYKVTGEAEGFTGTFRSTGDGELMVALARRTGENEEILAQGMGPVVKITDYRGRSTVSD